MVTQPLPPTPPRADPRDQGIWLFIKPNSLSAPCSATGFKWFLILWNDPEMDTFKFWAWGSEIAKKKKKKNTTQDKSLHEECRAPTKLGSVFHSTRTKSV